MTEFTRPRRVVIVDAENPLQEIRGEFFWREDHERIVADERRSSYFEGYQRGLEAAAQSPRARIIVRPTRPRRLRRVAVRAFILVLLVAFLVEVLVPTILSVV